MLQSCEGAAWIFVTLVVLTKADAVINGSDICDLDKKILRIPRGNQNVLFRRNITDDYYGSKNKCLLELETCGGCHFQVKFFHVGIPACPTENSECSCDSVRLEEPSYSTSVKEVCGYFRNNSSLIYETQTNRLSITFSFVSGMNEGFLLLYKSLENNFVLTGRPMETLSNNNSSGVFKSPHFPEEYKRDFSANYTLKNLDPSGYVQLIFDDFQIAPQSVLKIYNHNNSLVGVYPGSTFRPAVVVSTGPYLRISFEANGWSKKVGFKAQFIFVKYPETEWTNKPSTDCGGFVAFSGGVISGVKKALMKPGSKWFDCIWLIQRPYYNWWMTRLYLKVEEFEETGATLEIRRGSHSEAPLLDKYTSYIPVKDAVWGGHTGESSGFYVRLRGYFDSRSKLLLVYSGFSFRLPVGCPNPPDFICENGRCIDKELVCNMYNHCGDRSDEYICYPQSTEQTWFPPSQGSPGYKNLNSDPSFDLNPDQSSTTLILIASLAGLTLVILSVIIIMARLYRHRQPSPALPIPSISAGLDDIALGNDLQIQGNLPRYDAPPTYDDAMKEDCGPPPIYGLIFGENPLGLPTREISAPQISRDLDRGFILEIPIVNEPPSIRFNVTSSIVAPVRQSIRQETPPFSLCPLTTSARSNQRSPSLSSDYTSSSEYSWQINEAYEDSDVPSTSDQCRDESQCSCHGACACSHSTTFEPKNIPSSDTQETIVSDIDSEDCLSSQGMACESEELKQPPLNGIWEEKELIKIPLSSELLFSSSVSVSVPRKDFYALVENGTLECLDESCV